MSLHIGAVAVGMIVAGFCIFGIEVGVQEWREARRRQRAYEDIRKRLDGER